MSSTDMCLKYENEEIEWPTLRGQKVDVEFLKKLSTFESDETEELINPLEAWFAMQKIKSETEVEMTRRVSISSCDSENLDDTLKVSDSEDETENSTGENDQETSKGLKKNCDEKLPAEIDEV